MQNIFKGDLGRSMNNSLTRYRTSTTATDCISESCERRPNRLFVPVMWVEALESMIQESLLVTNMTLVLDVVAWETEAVDW